MLSDFEGVQHGQKTGEPIKIHENSSAQCYLGANIILYRFLFPEVLSFIMTNINYEHELSI